MKLIKDNNILACKPFIAAALMLLLLNACTIRIALNDYQIPPEMETFSVQYFPNRAQIVQPQLSQRFTDALQDKIESATPLRLVSGMGHGNFEGEIKTYSTRPVAVTSGDVAASNRLTVGILVKYTNQFDSELDFEKTFSRYADYSSSSSLDAVEDGLIEEILDQILEDILNAAFSNW